MSQNSLDNTIFVHYLVAGWASFLGYLVFPEANQGKIFEYCILAIDRRSIGGSRLKNLEGAFKREVYMLAK